MSNANGSGTAQDAHAATARTPDQERAQDYAERLADEAEAAVKNVEDTIAALKESLAERKAAAKAARADADKGQD